MKLINIALWVPALWLVLLSCSKQQKIELEYGSTNCTQIINPDKDNSHIKFLDIINLNDKPEVFYFDASDASLNFIDVNDTSNLKNHQKYYVPEIAKKPLFGQGTSKWLIVNFDTIFALSHHHRPNTMVYMFNVYDQLIDSFPLHRSKNDDYVCTSSRLSRMKFNKASLVIPANAQVCYHKETNEYEEVQAVVLNIENRTIEPLSRTSKEKILDFTRYSSPYDYFDFIEDKVVFSSEEDEHIYVYDIQTKTYKSYLAKSKYIKAVDPLPDSLVFDRLAITKYSKESARYEKIKYNPYRKMIYRLVKHKNKMPESEGVYKPELPRAQYSMLVMDRSFNIIDEILLDKDHDYNLILSTKQGSIVPNRLKSDLKESGQLCLDVFKIK